MISPGSIKGIQWKKRATRSGYSLMELQASLVGCTSDMNEHIGWKYSDQLYTLARHKVTSYYSERDAQSFEVWISTKSAAFVLKKNKLIRETIQSYMDSIQNSMDVLTDAHSTKHVLTVLERVFEMHRACYSLYRFPGLVDAYAGKKIATETVVDDCARTRDFAGHAFQILKDGVTQKCFVAIAKICSYSIDELFFMTYEEIVHALKNTGSAVSIIDSRSDFVILGVMSTKQFLLYGDEGKKLFASLCTGANDAGDKQIKSLTGRSVFPGVVTADVRVVFNIDELKLISRDIVLITPMTTVDFLPYLKHVVGIVTDEGGITCHAAIISRELGIPCIVGTKFATKVLKDGMTVTVDADKNLIKIH